MKKPLADRFWSKVNILSVDECWEWTGGIFNTGYGCFHSTDNSLILAHRQSWILANGKIPNGICVLHGCDNPICVNPAHLFLGTRSDNSADKVSKNRQAKGESVGNAKLTATQVTRIRHHYKCGKSQKSIARLFGVSSRTIRGVVRHETWKHVT